MKKLLLAAAIAASPMVMSAEVVNPQELTEKQEAWLDKHRKGHRAFGRDWDNHGVLGSIFWIRVSDKYYSTAVKNLATNADRMEFLGKIQEEELAEKKLVVDYVNTSLELSKIESDIQKKEKEIEVLEKIVEVEKLVEVLVEVEVPKEVIVEKVVEKIKTEIVVEKEIVEVEKKVEVLVQKIVEVDKGEYTDEQYEELQSEVNEATDKLAGLVHEEHHDKSVKEQLEVYIESVDEFSKEFAKTLAKKIELEEDIKKANKKIGELEAALDGYANAQAAFDAGAASVDIDQAIADARDAALETLQGKLEDLNISVSGYTDPTVDASASGSHSWGSGQNMYLGSISVKDNNGKYITYNFDGDPADDTWYQINLGSKQSSISNINQDEINTILAVAEAAYKQGYEDGYNDGYEAGYNDGYSDGFTDGVKSVK